MVEEWAEPGNAPAPSARRSEKADALSQKILQKGRERGRFMALLGKTGNLKGFSVCL